MKGLFKILLVISTVVLAYLCVKSIMDPIHFDEEKANRDRAVIQRLMDIRKAQVEYRNLNGRYMADFDTLVNFVKTGKMPVVMKEGVLSDFQLEAGMTDEKALRIIKSGKQAEIEKNGLVGFRRDTVYVNIIDTIFGEGFVADSLPFVPGTSVKFEMKVGEIPSASGFAMKVFEAKTPFDVYLNGLDRQQVINLKDRAKKLDKYPGLQVGSVDVANNNAGNWE